MILINLIVSELLISVAGVPFDVLGAFTKGEALHDNHCQIAAFVHTLFGKKIFCKKIILIN